MPRARVTYTKVKKLGEGAQGVVFKAQVCPGPSGPLSVRDLFLQGKLEPRAAVVPSRKHSRDQETDTTAGTPMKKAKKNDTSGGETTKIGGLPEFVAVKKIRVKDSKEGLSMDAVREIKLLQELDHPNVVRVLDLYNDGGNVNLVLPLGICDLENIIHDRSIVLTPADIKSYMFMLMSAVEHCHANWIIHRDIKPGNLLVAADGRILLADFGGAKIFGSPDRNFSPQACTRWYRAPELLFGARSYGAGLDLWSCGCVFAELHLREGLFPGMTDLDQLSKIFHVLGNPTEAAWPGVSSLPHYTGYEQVSNGDILAQKLTGAAPHAIDLLSSLLQLNPSQRISATDALAHPYFSSAPTATHHTELPQPAQTPSDRPDDWDI